MPKPGSITIVNVGYRSTNYWVVSAGTSRLLVDLGWPGTMARLRAGLARIDVPIKEIRYGLATHYHIDDAGLGQELKEAGVPLLVLDAQVRAIPLMKSWIKPQDQYVDITLHDNVTISFPESRSVLERIGPTTGGILSSPERDHKWQTERDHRYCAAPCSSDWYECEILASTAARLGALACPPI
jgi:hypothetical protein